MKSVPDMAELGGNTVTLVVGWHQQDVFANTLRPGPSTPTDDDARAVARVAQAHGMSVVVFPIVLVDELAPGRWRGTLAPTDIQAWWSSYETFILHYARVATSVGAAHFSVGSELGSTEAWRDRWYHLIGRVRREFAGTLLYSANWDRYASVSFWPRLDLIGVTGYFELTKDRAADEAVLAGAWRRVRASLVEFAEQRRLPLWLSEVGYTSRDGSAVSPWDYTSSAPVDLEEQRRAFSALATVWKAGGLDGVVVWEWARGDGRRDRGYTPRGKPAAGVLARWWRGDCWPQSAAPE